MEDQMHVQNEARRSRLRLAVLPAVLGLLLGAVVAVSVVLWSERGDQTSGVRDVGGSDEQWAAAHEIAEQTVTAFFSLDHRDVAADVAAARALMTEEFGDDYAREAGSLTREVVRKKLTLVPTLVPDGTATETFGREAAQVLVSVDVATVTAAGVSEDARYRTRVALVRDGDGWLVTGLDQVG